MVKLNALERLGAIHGSIAVSLAQVSGARIATQPFRELRGLRMPGTALPGIIALGSWRFVGGEDFVAIYRGRPAIVVDLHGAQFNRLIIDAANTEATLARLNDALRSQGT